MGSLVIRVVKSFLNPSGLKNGTCILSKRLRWGLSLLAFALAFILAFALALVLSILAFALGLVSSWNAKYSPATVVSLIKCDRLIHAILVGELNKRDAFARTLIVQRHPATNKLTTLAKVLVQGFLGGGEREAPDEDSVFVSTGIFALLPLALALLCGITSFHAHFLGPTAILATLWRLSESLVIPKLLIIGCVNPIFGAIAAFIRIIFPLLILFCCCWCLCWGSLGGGNFCFLGGWRFVRVVIGIGCLLCRNLWRRLSFGLRRWFVATIIIRVVG